MEDTVALLFRRRNPHCRTEPAKDLDFLSAKPVGSRYQPILKHPIYGILF